MSPAIPTLAAPYRTVPASPPEGSAARTVGEVPLNVRRAAGLYYVAMLTVFLGEVLGRFLLALASLPL